MSETNLTPAPRDAELRIFLVEIAKYVSKENLKDMKFIMKGPDGIGRYTLERISSPLDFFELLVDQGFLNVNNIAVLQALLWHTGRKDLFRRASDFAEEHKNAIYLHTPNTTPAQGYKYVTFHVRGKLSKTTLEDLRCNVAKWLGVPQQFVVVAGVEITESFNVTLMIPDVCTDMLCEHAPVNSEWFVLKGIDTCRIDGKDIDLTDSGKCGPTSTEDEDLSLQELKRLMQYKKYLESRVDALQKLRKTSLTPPRPGPHSVPVNTCHTSNSQPSYPESNHSSTATMGFASDSNKRRQPTESVACRKKPRKSLFKTAQASGGEGK